MKNSRQQIIQAMLTVVAVCIATTTAIAGPGNYNQQGPMLVGTGGAFFQDQGWSVALSADGNTALVGGPGTATGAAWVFTRSNGVWTQEGQKLVGTGSITNTGALGQGWSVALSADGNTAVVGSFSDNSYVGAVWVFVRSNGVWTQQGDKLVGTGATSPASQGNAVAISADGNTLVEYGSDIQSGNSEVAVWVFTRSGGVWTQQGSKLASGFGVGLFGTFTNSVAISADGNTVAASAFLGSVLVFKRSNGVWTQQGNKLLLPPGSGSVTSVSLTADGNTLLANGWFFYRKNGVWSQSGAQLVVPNTNESYFVISADGGTVIAGSNFQVTLFVRTGGWHLQNIYNAYGAQYSAALSANGDTMIVGEPPLGAGASGAAQVFAAPQLFSTLTHTGDFHQGQTGATYTMTAKNIGDRAIHADTTETVILVDRLPSGLTATNIAGNGWTCTVTTATCTRDDGLAVGASYPPVTVTVNVATNAPPTIINLATAKGGGSNWGNSFDPTTILP